MPSLREIRRKIKSVKSTEQITKAMKMVAAARMRRAQQAILASRPFAVRMEEAVRNLALLEAPAHAGREEEMHPFFRIRPAGPACLVVVSADKGLCGAFNANILRATIDWLKKHRERKMYVAVAGRKARELVHRLRDFDIEHMSELIGIFPKITYAHAEILGREVIDGYLQSKFSTVDVIYNEFKSVVSQKVIQAQLLPILVPKPAEEREAERDSFSSQFKFEPRKELLLQALLPRSIKAQLYRILLESQAAELAARMNAMDSASKNAGELIGSLTLGLNRTRQGIITREIAELVGGAEALSA